MPKMTPAEHAALWAQKFSGSADRYKQGIQKVQGNPAQKAIAAKDRCLAGFTAAIQDGKWEAGLSQVTEQSWKQACLDKGANALAASARVAQDKVQRAEARIGPIRDSIKANLPPRGTIEQNLERAREMAMKMHEATRRG